MNTSDLIVSKKGQYQSLVITNTNTKPVALLSAFKCFKETCLINRNKYKIANGSNGPIWEYYS